MIEVEFTACVNGDRSIFPPIPRRVCVAGDGKIDLSPFNRKIDLSLFTQAILEISWNS
jgi:hypothetical protein